MDSQLYITISGYTSQENGLRAEWATITLQGYYGSQHSEVNFFHILHRYNRELTSTDVNNDKLREDQNSSEISLNLNSYGIKQIAQCLDGPIFVQCEVVTGYRNILSTLRVFAARDIEKGILEGIVNSALGGINARIIDLEK